MKLRPNHDAINILIMNLMKQKAKVQLKGPMEFCYCSLSLFPAREGHKGLYLRITNGSLSKCFKAQRTEYASFDVIRINKQEKAKVSFRITLVVGQYLNHDINTKFSH